MADNEEHDISGMGSEDAEENEMLKKTRENWKRIKYTLKELVHAAERQRSASQGCQQEVGQFVRSRVQGTTAGAQTC